MVYARQVVGAIRGIGRGARAVSKYATMGSQFARRLGSGAGEFQKTPLGAFVGEKVPIAGRITKGISTHAPAVSAGLEKLSTVASKLQGLENVQLDGN